jgi:hypothetical protein
VISALELSVGMDDVPAPVAPAADRIGVMVPNPFHPRGRVPFELARSGRTLLTVHDPAGRLVRVLVDRVLPAGPHAAEWDGRDAVGREVRSGVYFVRLAGQNGIATRKVVALH